MLFRSFWAAVASTGQDRRMNWTADGAFLPQFICSATATPRPDEPCRDFHASLHQNKHATIKANQAMRRSYFNLSLLAISGASLIACGGQRTSPSDVVGADARINDPVSKTVHPEELETNNTIWDIFRSGSPENSVQVNRYLWAASLEVLDFLPLQTVDPFTGVIVTGFGTPPGSGRAYRATVLIDDPALEARSLNLALQTRSGPASAATMRAVEDAILTRARQLRVADGQF